MWSDLLYRLRALVRPRKVESELDDEIAFHLEQQTQKLLRSGLSRPEAVRQARLSLAGPEQTKERCREARGIGLLHDLARDLQYALRQLRHSPGFAAVTILLLALGIGANTAIFSLLDAVMLRPLPVRNPQALFTLKWSARQEPGYKGYSSFEACYGHDFHAGKSGCSFSYPMFQAIHARSASFTSVAAFAGPAQMTLTGAGAASMVQVELVSGDFFQTIGINAALGRTLQPDDENPAAPPVVMLSYGYWQSAFGGAASAMGKTIRLNGVPVTIVGVSQPRFNRLSPGKLYEMWLPLTQRTRMGINWGSASLESDTDWWLALVTRLRQGATAAQAQQEASAIFANQLVNGSKLAKPGSQPRIELIEANKGFTGYRSWLAKPLSILMTAVGILLLITCANTAGLLIARAAVRRREMAIRLAVGASRGRIFRQLLTESVLLSTAGGLLGVLVAWCGVRLLSAFLTGQSGWSLNLQIAPDTRVLVFTVGASLLSGIVFGVFPALHSAQVDPASPEGNTARAGWTQALSLTRRRSKFGNGLVVLQIALTATLLFGAGLCVRTLHNLRHANTGFDIENVLLFSIDPTMGGYHDARCRRFVREVQERLSALPGVTHVTYSSDTLLAGGLWSDDVKIEGNTSKTPLHLKMFAVGPGFFETMRIPLLAGLPFSSQEMDAARPVAAVNAEFVRRFLDGRSPLGLHFAGTDPHATQYRIVAVTGNALYDELRSGFQPTAYVPFEGQGGATFELKTAVDPASIIPAVRRLVSGLDKNLPLTAFHTQRQQIDQLLFIERLIAYLAALFGLLALTLSCVGVYGLLSYEVSRRTRETGIRIAVGAQPRTVVAGILRETLWLALAGLAIGVPASLAASRALTALLFEVKPTDPFVLGAGAVFLLLAAALASYLPARRASHIDPIVALRHE